MGIAWDMLQVRIERASMRVALKASLVFGPSVNPKNYYKIITHRDCHYVAFETIRGRVKSQGKKRPKHVVNAWDMRV